MSTHKYYNTKTNNQQQQRQQQQQQQQQQKDTKKNGINLNKKRRLSAIILSLFVTIFQVEKCLIIKIAWWLNNKKNSKHPWNGFFLLC